MEIAIPKPAAMTVVDEETQVPEIDLTDEQLIELPLPAVDAIEKFIAAFQSLTREHNGLAQPHDGLDVEVVNLVAPIHAMDHQPMLEH